MHFFWSPIGTPTRHAHTENKDDEPDTGEKDRDVISGSRIGAIVQVGIAFFIVIASVALSVVVIRRAVLGSALARIIVRVAVVVVVIVGLVVSVARLLGVKGKSAAARLGDGVVGGGATAAQGLEKGALDRRGHAPNHSEPVTS